MLFFPMDPLYLQDQIRLSHRGTERATAITKAFPAQGTLASTPTDATGQDVVNPIPVLDAQGVAKKPQTILPKGPQLPLDQGLEYSLLPHGKGKLDNLGGVCCSINVDRLEHELSGHPSPPFVQKLCKDLREGARIGYEGERKPTMARNLPSARQNQEKVAKNLSKEVELGRTAGPFSEPPFPNLQMSPLGIIPKKNSEKFRKIFHLSYPKSGDSINSGINKEEFSLQYSTTDQAISSIQALGNGTLMAKTDIESAFRLFPVHPEDWELLGMKWDGQYYFDKVLPFGLRSAPYLFNQLSEGLEWILLNKCGISFVAHFLDDFLIMEPPTPGDDLPLEGRISLSSMLLTFKGLNIPLSAGKTQGTTTKLEFLGITLDSVLMQASLPEDKVLRLQEELKMWSTRRKATLKELQSLIGSLNFACKVVPPGRAFLQRIINLTIGISKPHHHIKLNKAFYGDINMWQNFVEHWNCKQSFLNATWDTSTSLHLFTDASGTIGYGGIHGKQWFQGKWEEHQTLGAEGISINWQELYAIVVACRIWGHCWSAKKNPFSLR